MRTSAAAVALRAAGRGQRPADGLALGAERRSLAGHRHPGRWAATTTRWLTSHR